jgi:hypothetical protein
VSLLEIVVLPIRILHDQPLWALLPAAGLAALAFAARARPRHAPAFLWPAGTAVLWLAYAAYEVRMRQWERTVTAPIRIDLLLIGPILAAATLGSVIAALRGRVRPSP